MTGHSREQVTLGQLLWAIAMYILCAAAVVGALGWAWAKIAEVVR